MSGDDPLLDDFVRATRVELDRRLEASEPLRDLAAVFERAHELDPTLVDEQTLAHARELAPVVPLRARTEQDDELAPFRAALREQLDAGVAERRAREIPAPRFIRPRPLRRRSAGRWAAAAIVLVLFGGVVSAMIGGELLGGGDADSSLVRTLESLRLSPEPEPIPEPVSPPPISDEPVPSASSEEPEVDPKLDEEPEPAPRPPSSPKPKPTPDESLAELDARAQALWRAGDLDGAEQLFHEIVRRGGRGRWAELAYGELFSLAQRHSGDEREVLWRDYLAAFPKGRYVEDARAGLCRRAAGSEREACWSEYISRHPEGTHAPEARRALGLDESQP